MLILRAALLLLALPLAAAAQPPLSPPNVVLVVFDDLGWGDLGAYGGSFVETPRLDALAAAGMRFTQAYASASICSPSRAGLLTGRHPTAFGMRQIVEEGSLRGLPPDAPSLARVFAAAGYATGHFGKWHLGFLPEFLPDALGFDHYAIRNENGSYIDPTLLVDGSEVPSAGHLTEITTQRAIDFVEAHAQQPFFLNVWYHAPHRPYEAPAQWRLRYPATDDGAYAALVSHADAELGRLLDRIAELGLAGRTLVIATSDNGGTQKSFPTNGPLRAGKRSVYEGGLRVPLVASWPGQVPEGAQSAEIAAGTDLLPTFAALVGVRHADALADGRSLLPRLLGAPTPKRSDARYFEIQARESHEPLGAVRRGDWKLVMTAGRSELYDLAADPSESTDLAASRPEQVAALGLEHRLWRQRVPRIGRTLALEGAALRSGDWLRLDGGAQLLEPEVGLRIGEEQLSFAVRIVPDSVGSLQAIAQHPGAWRLVLTAAGSVRLVAHEAGTELTETLESAPLARAGVPMDVVFSISGLRRFRSRIDLYVDGALAASSERLRGIASSSAPVRLGSNEHGLRPFIGWLWRPEFHQRVTSALEAADRDLDGAADRDDVCIGAPDGPLLPDAGGLAQRDSDGDGFGNACDADFDGDGRVGVGDLLALYAAFGREAAPELAHLDLDGDGVVGTFDLLRAQGALGTPPGPSALAP